MELLKYANNAQTHGSTNLTPFNLVLSRHPHGPTMFVNPMDFWTETIAMKSLHAPKATLLHCTATMHQDREKRMN